MKTIRAFSVISALIFVSVLAAGNSTLAQIEDPDERLDRCWMNRVVVSFDSGRGLRGPGPTRLNCANNAFPNDCTNRPQYPACTGGNANGAPPGTPPRPIPWREMQGRCPSTAGDIPIDALTGLRNCLAPIGGNPGMFMCNDHVWWWKLLMYSVAQGNNTGQSASSLGICAAQGNGQGGLHVLGVLCDRPTAAGTKTCWLHDNAMNGNALARYNAQCQQDVKADGKVKLFTWTQAAGSPPVPPSPMLGDIQHTYCCMGMCLPRGSCFCSSNPTMQDDNTGRFPPILMNPKSPEAAEFIRAFQRLTGIKIENIDAWQNVAGDAQRITLTLLIPSCACDKRCTVRPRRMSVLPVPPGPGAVALADYVARNISSEESVANSIVASAFNELSASELSEVTGIVPILEPEQWVNILGEPPAEYASSCKPYEIPTSGTGDVVDAEVTPVLPIKIEPQTPLTPDQVPSGTELVIGGAQTKMYQTDKLAMP